MHAALHADVAAVPSKSDDIACPDLVSAGRWNMMNTCQVPFIDLQIVIPSPDLSSMGAVPHDRNERDELTDIRSSFVSVNPNGLPFQCLRRHDHIFQALVTSGRDVRSSRCQTRRITHRNRPGQISAEDMGSEFTGKLHGPRYRAAV
jgi:hypothetical protein